MRLICLGSSSKGNCYILKGCSETLILEAGVNFVEVKKALEFDLTDVVGCVVTHEHGDHSKALKQIESSFIPVYASGGTLSKTKVNGTQVNHLKQTTIGGFQIIPFAIKHDAAEPFAYCIHHKECGRILFITDSASFPYRLSGISHFIIEANFSEKLADKYAIENPDSYSNVKRLKESHLEINVTKEILQENIDGHTKNIILCHLSDRHSIKEEFKKIIARATGKPVYIANELLNLEL